MKLVYFFCGGMKLGAEREDTREFSTSVLSTALFIRT